MSEAGRHPQLFFIFTRKLNPNPLAKSRRAAAHVYRYIEHAARGHANQFALGVFELIVQAAQRALARQALIVLHESGVDTALAKMRGAKGFHEVAAVIAMYRGLEN